MANVKHEWFKYKKLNSKVPLYISFNITYKILVDLCLASLKNELNAFDPVYYFLTLVFQL